MEKKQLNNILKKSTSTTCAILKNTGNKTNKKQYMYKTEYSYKEQPITREDSSIQCMCTDWYLKVKTTEGGKKKKRDKTE